LVPGGHGKLDLYFNDNLTIGHTTTEGGHGLGRDDPRRFLDAKTVSAKIRDWRESVGRPVTQQVGGRVDASEADLHLNRDDPQLESTRSKYPSQDNLFIWE
jgi:hypothetical protein